MGQARALARRAGCVFLMTFAVLSGASQGKTKEGQKMSQQSWRRFAELVDERKLQEALDVAEGLRKAAAEKGDDAQWTKGLVSEAMLRILLGKYETAVQQLRAASWPKAPEYRAVVQLYYAQALANYLSSYAWEIRQREVTVAKDVKGKLDLKTWTQDEIYGEALRAMGEAWAHREALGAKKLSAYKEYFAPNNYPAGVRDTFRDLLSYQAADLLAQASFWQASEESSVYRLQLDALLSETPSKNAGFKLDDDKFHPLQRMSGVYADLEAWHEQAGRGDAYLAARIDHFRKLHAAFTRKDQRTQLMKKLDDELGSHATSPFWSVGMAALAEFQRESGDLVKAHATAKAGEMRHPGSIGATYCAVIRAEIAAPDYQVQSMKLDGLKKESIAVTHRNVEKLYFRAWRVDVARHLQTQAGYEIVPGSDELLRFVRGNAKPTAAWEVSLPKTADFTSRRTFVTPELAGQGYYLIAASARPDFKEDKNRVVGLGFFAASFVVTTSSDATGSLEAAAHDGETGAPLEGVEVELFRHDYKKAPVRLKSGKTDAHGFVRFPGGGSDVQGSIFLVARRGSEMVIDDQYRYLHGGERETGVQASFIYTDRSIYRPQQALLFKVVAYKSAGKDYAYKAAPDTDVTVELLDPSYQVVAARKLKTNAYGSAAGSFDVPAGRLLGHWTLRSSYGGTQRGVRVEEYKRPTFEVSIKDAQSALRLNQKATLKGEARYYFGLPVTSGKVTWKLARQPVFPWWWGYVGGARGSTREETIASGTARLDDKGAFELSFLPAADEALKDDTGGLTYRYAVTADVTDEGGETRSASRHFRLGFSSVEAQIAMEQGYVEAGDAATLTVKRTNLDGVARPGKATWRLVRLQEPAKTSTPAELPVEGNAADDAGPVAATAKRARWETSYTPEATMSRWQDGADLAQGDLEHGDKGEVELKLPSLEAGAYRLRYETTDDFGQVYKTWKDVIVGGTKTTLALPALLKADVSTAKVGETVKVLVHSGFKDQELVLESFQDGKRMERKVLKSGDPEIVSFKVKDEARGGFGLRLTVVRDYQVIKLEEAVFVPWDDKTLDVSFTTFRDELRPGAKETFKVKVKGAKGDALAAEVLAYMYDKSLDAFAAHAAPNPLGLYPMRTGVPPLATDVGATGGYHLIESDFVRIPNAPELHGDELHFAGLRGSGFGFGRHGFGGGSGAGQYALSAPMASAPRAYAKRAMPGSKAKSEAYGEAETDMAAAPEAPQMAEAKVSNDARKSDGATEANVPGEGVQLRSNFAETAFFKPQLVTDAQGEVSFEFTAPDSVTAWNLWVHALTKDLRSGSASKDVRTVKELMTRVYAPRFLREGDVAEVKVVVNNAGKADAEGQVDFDVIELETGRSLAAQFGLKDKALSFKAPKGGSASVGFTVKAPRGVGLYAFKATAASDKLSDGEQRAVPVLPSRLHLVQSRFAALRGKATRELRFADLEKTTDASRVDEGLVVSVEGQLFYGILKAVPYLVTYPYECSEQTLNRFLATGIVSSVFEKYPAVARMAQEFSKRETPLEPFDAADPNRRTALEESPWLAEAQGGKTREDAGLVKVLDQRIARAEREASLARLRKMQHQDGGFPWFPGGPSSPYMTLYLLHGFAKAAEFGMVVPKEMVTRGWQYLAHETRSDLLPKVRKKSLCCAEFTTFIAYTASAYPDASWLGGALSEQELGELRDFGYEHWKKMGPYSRAYLALAMKRAGRAKEAMLVFDSIMDSAKSDPELGTFWQPEDRSWLWYNDTIEGHAFVLRALMELAPQDQRKDGLAQWLFLNKKLNHWKSTRATAEVIYALVHYLSREKALGVEEKASVQVGAVTESFTFEPDKYAGKRQLVISGEKIEPKSMSRITVQTSGPSLAFASAAWHFATDELPAEERGDFFTVKRRYFKRQQQGQKVTRDELGNGAVLAAGDEVEVQISLRAKHEAEYVHLRDPRGAGFEPVSQVSRFRWDLGVGFYEEVRDSGANYFFEKLPAGEYTFKYRVRAAMNGTFRVGPAEVQSMYAPEFAAYSAGNILEVKEPR